MKIAARVARLLLAALFLYAGSAKLTGNPESVAVFDRIGMGQWLRLFVGAAEVAGAVGLLLAPLAGLAALGLAALMVGAVASHLLVLGGNPAPAVVALLLAAFVAARSLRAPA